MKKILTLLLIFAFSIIVVNAEVYQSKTGDKQMSQEKRIEFEITTNFTETQTNLCYGKGIYELPVSKANEFYKQGKGKFVNSSEIPEETIDPNFEEVPAVSNVSKPETELPDKFPFKKLLIENEFDTAEKVQAAGKEKLLAIDGIGEVGVTKIGLALDELLKQ